MCNMDKGLERFREIVALSSAADAPSSDVHVLVRVGLAQAELLLQETDGGVEPSLFLEILKGVSLLHVAGVMAAAELRPPFIVQ